MRAILQASRYDRSRPCARSDGHHQGERKRRPPVGIGLHRGLRHHAPLRQYRQHQSLSVAARRHGCSCATPRSLASAHLTRNLPAAPRVYALRCCLPRSWVSRHHLSRSRDIAGELQQRFRRPSHATRRPVRRDPSTLPARTSELVPAEHGSRPRHGAVACKCGRAKEGAHGRGGGRRRVRGASTGRVREVEGQGGCSGLGESFRFARHVPAISYPLVPLA